MEKGNSSKRMLAPLLSLHRSVRLIVHRIEQLLEHSADRAFTFPSTFELRRLINIVNIYYCSDHLKWKIREHFYVLGTKRFYIDYLIPIIIILVFQCRKLFREVK